MSQYHKIQTVYKRDPENKYKTLLEGHWAKPEFGKLAHLDWSWQEKVDGTNVRVWFDGCWRFGGKTDRAQMPVPLLQHLQDLFADSVMPEGLENAVLYGEGFGAGIQKGGAYADGPHFTLFDLCTGTRWAEREEVNRLADELMLWQPSTFEGGSLFEAIKFTESGFNSAYGDAQSEGLICRPPCEILNTWGERIITKIKTKDFL